MTKTNRERTVLEEGALAACRAYGDAWAALESEGLTPNTPAGSRAYTDVRAAHDRMLSAVRAYATSVRPKRSAR